MTERLSPNARVGSDRGRALSGARRVVIKLGTQLLTDERGLLDVAFVRDVARQVAALRARGIEVALVTSGAVGAGMGELGRTRRPEGVAEQQATAAVGQGRLMAHFHAAFEPLGVRIAQLLLTREDFEHRGRFLNIRNCLRHLQRLGCLPVINENDTVAVEELRFGDNDQLAALIATALEADALVLATVVAGVLDESGERIPVLGRTDATRSLAWAGTSSLGTGGMRSKLAAAELVRDAGEWSVIADGRTPDLLPRLFDGEEIGTVIAPAGRRLDARRRWIGLTKRPAGTVTVDDGAVEAIRSRGKSLLPIGVIGVRGGFARGDVVRVASGSGAEIARGLSNYAAEELERIRGRRSAELDELLGEPGYAEVIHRDHLMVPDGPVEEAARQ